MQKIVYTRADGGLSIIHPAISRDDPEGFTEQQAVERAMSQVPADAIGVRVVEESAIPTDRTFRDAWKVGATAVEVDMSLALEIQKDRLRIERTAKMADADVEFLKALEAWLKTQPSLSAPLQAAMDQKQALRDVTTDPALTTADTPEELAAVMPAVLK